MAADDPLAYGIDRLRHARITLAEDQRAIDNAIPDDRGDQWKDTRRELPDKIRVRHQAEAMLAEERARLQDAGRRHWGRRNERAIADAQARVAVAEGRAAQSVGAERELRERLAALADHQQKRQRQIADSAPKQQRLQSTLEQIDAALNRTRAARVAALADQPPAYLIARIGPAPKSPAGKAVWCHHALAIEAALDRTAGLPSGGGRSRRTDLARHQILVADRVLEVSSEKNTPAGWAELAQQAAVVLDQVRRVESGRVSRQVAAGQLRQPEPAPWIERAAAQTHPGISL